MITRFDPRSGASDLLAVIRQPQRHRWLILTASAFITGSLIWMVTHETIYAPPERPSVTYITTFAPDRSDAEIAAANAEHARVQDALRQLSDEREERRRQMYRDLGRATGLDVDAMEERIRAEEAAEAAAAAEGANSLTNAR